MKVEIIPKKTKLRDMKPGDCFMKSLDANDVFLVTFDEASGKQNPFWDYSKESGIWAVNLSNGGHACYGQIDMEVYAVQPTLKVEVSYVRYSV